MRKEWFNDDGLSALILRRYTNDATTRCQTDSRIELQWLSDTLLGWSVFAAVVSVAVTIPVLWGANSTSDLLVRSIIPSGLWLITALLLALSRGYLRRLQVGKDVLADIQAVVNTIPDPLASTMRRGVQNTRTVIEECYRRTGRENSALVIQANATLSAMCDTALNLSQMLAIEKRNNEIKGGTDQIAITMKDARKALVARIEAARERVADLDSALAMLAQASFIIGDGADDDAIIGEVIASTRALLEVGNQTIKVDSQMADGSPQVGRAEPQRQSVT